MLGNAFCHNLMNHPFLLLLSATYHKASSLNCGVISFLCKLVKLSNRVRSSVLSSLVERKTRDRSFGHQILQPHNLYWVQIRCLCYASIQYWKLRKLKRYLHCKVIIGRNPIEANANTVAIQLSGNPVAYTGKCFTPY